MQSQVRQLPPGITPPLVLKFSASSVPVIQLALSSPTLPEQTVFDAAVNQLRPQLVTIPGVAIPFPYGGKIRVIAVDLDLPAMQARGLAPADVVAAVNTQNLILPSGTVKFGESEFSVRMNASPDAISGLNELPVRTQAGATTYLRDVAQVRDGCSPQSSIVRQDGERGVLRSVMKTRACPRRHRGEHPRTAAAGERDPAARHQGDADLRPVGVRKSIGHRRHHRSPHRRGAHRPPRADLPRQLAQHRDHRPHHTVVAARVDPHAVCVRSDAEHHDARRARALGRDPRRHGDRDDREHRAPPSCRHTSQAIIVGAGEIGVPAFVSTLCICIVFVPMFFLSGVARFLFVPMAMAVVFAMVASFILSRTLVPTLVMLMMGGAHAKADARPGPLKRVYLVFDAQFERVRQAYTVTLASLLQRRKGFALSFLGFTVVSCLLYPVLGRDFFPMVDAGQIRCISAPRPGRASRRPLASLTRSRERSAT